MKKQRKDESRIHHDEGNGESRREHRHTDQDCLYLRAGDTHRWEGEGRTDKHTQVLKSRGREPETGSEWKGGLCAQWSHSSHWLSLKDQKQFSTVTTVYYICFYAVCTSCYHIYYFSIDLSCSYLILHYFFLPCGQLSQLWQKRILILIRFFLFINRWNRLIDSTVNNPLFTHTERHRFQPFRSLKVRWDSATTSHKVDFRRWVDEKKQESKRERKREKTDDAIHPLASLPHSSRY